MANEAVRFLRGTWTNYWKTAPTQDASTKKYNYSQAATNYKDCIYFCITGGSTLTADIKNAGVILLNCAPYTLNEDELKTYIETVKLNVNNGLSKITETSGESIKFTPLLFADQDKDASANIITKNDIITNILYTGGKNIYANVNNAALYLQCLNAYTSIYAGNTITIGGLGNTISATTTGAEYKYYRKMSASSTIDKGIVYDIDNLKIYSELHESNGKTAYINLNNNSDITLSSDKSIKNIAPNILFNFGTSYSSAPNYVDLRPNNDISVYTQRTLGISSYDSSISVSHNLVANISTATIGTTNMAVNTSKGSVAFNDYTGTSISGTQLTLSSTKTAANNTTNNPNVVLKLKNNKTTGINFNDDFVMTYDHDTSSMVLHHGNDIFTKIKKESVNNAWYNSILPNGNVRIGSNSNYFNDGAFLELHSARSISTRWDAYDSNEFVTKSAVESVLPTLGSMRHKGIITIDTYATKLSGKHFVGDSYIVSGDIDAIGGKNGDIIVANDAALGNSSSANEFTDSTYVAAHWNLIRLVNSDVIMHDGNNKNETWTSGTVPIVTGTDKINKSPLITDSSYSVLQSVSGSSTYVISGKSGSSHSSTLFNNTGNAQDIHDKLIPTLGILDYYKNQIVSNANSAYMQFPKYVLNNYTSGNPTNYLTANRNTMGYIYEAPNTGNSGAAPNTAVHYGNNQSTKNVSLNKARIFAIAGKSGANDSSYMSGIINTDNKWFVTTSLHDYRDSYEVGTTNNIYITSASGTYYKNLTVFDNSVSIPNYDITNNSLSGVEKIIIAGNATSNEFISYRSGQKIYLPNPSNIDKNITNTFVISQDISTMATQKWVQQQGYLTELSAATTNALGAIKIGYSANGKNYPVMLDNNYRAYVSVPWTNTTYTLATGDSNGQIKVTPSSGSAYNVSVKGLGSAAYLTANTSATNSTVAQRTANGYLFATYFNQSSGTDTPTENSYWLFANSDGYFRKSTRANLESTIYPYEAKLQWGGRNFSGTYGCIDAAMVPELGANRAAFCPASAITIQYSTNGGSSWTDYGASDAQKRALFSGVGTDLAIGKNTSAGVNYTNYRLRVIINTGSGSIYSVLNKFVIYISTNGSAGTWCTIDARLQSNVESSTDTWTTFASQVGISGWSGYNVINTSGMTTYGNTKANQYGQIRFTFGNTGYSSSYSGMRLYKIFCFGGVGWNTPSTMAKTGHLYSYNENQRAFFPEYISASGFIKSGSSDSYVLLGGGGHADISGLSVSYATTSGSCSGNAATATKLTSDAGSSVRPVYFSGGKPAECGFQVGNNSGNAAVSNGTVCTNLNADKLDGYDGSYYATKTDISTMATQKWVEDKGYITANGGSIGGWTIDEDRLFSNDAHASIRMDLNSGNINRAIRLGGTEINARDPMLRIRNDAGTCAQFSTYDNNNNNSKALSLVANGGSNTFALESRGNVKFGLNSAETFTFNDPLGDGRKSTSTGHVDFRVPITFNGMSTCHYYEDVWLPSYPSNGMFVFCKECRVFPTNGHPIMEPAGTSVITPVGGWYGTNDRSTFFVYSEKAGQWIAFYCG